MSKNPAAVYRTSDIGILTAYRTRLAEIREWYAEVDAFAKEVTGTDRVWLHTAFGRDRLTGLHLDEDQPVPKPWRRHAKHREVIVPHRISKAGRELGARFDALSVSPDYYEPLAGMPHAHLENSAIYFPSIRPVGGVGLEVSWAVEPRDPVGPQWEQVPLSQWHAEREETDA